MKKHKSHHFIKLLAPFLLIFTVAACTTQKTSSVVKTASIPLNDLNLVRSKIPDVLEQAKKAPYAVPTDQSCTSLNEMITALDEVLAPDIDTPTPESSKTSKAASSALSFISSK